jgi:Ca2+-binding RTX toxin-like protein
VAGKPPHIRGRRIVGTASSEYLAGGGHDDIIFGLGGNDTLLGGAGDDRIYGGPGNDVITGGAGEDHLYGGPGSDTIYAADGERDIIDCGPGRDRAVVDLGVDKTVNCEVVVAAPSQ